MSDPDIRLLRGDDGLSKSPQKGTKLRLGFREVEIPMEGLRAPMGLELVSSFPAEKNRPDADPGKRPAPRVAQGRGDEVREHFGRQPRQVHADDSTQPSLNAAIAPSRIAAS